MDTTARRRKSHKIIVSDSLNDLYPHDLNFYVKPPITNIQLSEFEDLALERVQLLRIIEQTSYKGFKPYSEDWKQCVKDDLIKANLKKYVRLMSGSGSSTDLDYQARRADHISHFILRLAYCRSETLRRWFLSRELEWFKIRFLTQTQQEIKKFLQLNELIYTPISQEEKESIREELINSYIGQTDVTVEVNEFYKVPFADVTSLVRGLKVYLKRGIAYIPLTDLVVCIQSKFRAHLSKELNRNEFQNDPTPTDALISNIDRVVSIPEWALVGNQLIMPLLMEGETQVPVLGLTRPNLGECLLEIVRVCRGLVVLELIPILFKLGEVLFTNAVKIYQHRLPVFDDERINPLLINLHNVHTGNNYTTQVDKESIDPANLDTFAKQHYPLCMRHMHENLRATHHAKHGCRMQYGLFLKGIGLLYEDAVKFWREEFTKLMDSNKFDKSYLYNINHQYGKVGNRVNYSPYSCIKIIMGSVGAGEHHGCPFRHWDQSVLSNKLLEYGISNEAVKEVIDLVSGGHYQIACGKYFELTHSRPPTNSINHPNQYFEESRNLSKETNPNTKKI